MAVAFSGGLDSSVLTACATRSAKVVACTAFAAGSGDQARAREAASALGVELVATELTKENVSEMLGALALPFVPTLMDRSLWCLFSAVARSARDAGVRVMLLGQLADELFGGYAKYAEALRKDGDEAASSMMRADIQGFTARGRVRDVSACGGLVEARFPFESREVVDFALRLPVHFKIRDGVRKAVLRRAAAIMGVPQELAAVRKKAAQYSSGIQKFVAGLPF